MLEKVQITPLQLLNLTNMPFTYMYSYMYVPDRVQGSAVMWKLLIDPRHILLKGTIYMKMWAIVTFVKAREGT